MKIEKTLLEDHRLKVIVETQEELFEEAKVRAAKKIARNTKIPGFRPGKAPYSMLVKQIGEEAIVEEATEIHIKDIYPKIIEQAEIEPYGPGTLENIKSYSPPTFEFSIPLKPVVELGDYKSLAIPYEQKLITEENIDDVLKELLMRQAILEPADRPVKHTDVVYIDITGKKILDDENTENLFSQQNIPVEVLDSESNKIETEWPFPGFSQNLIDLKVNDGKSLTYNFPEDFYIKDMAGINAQYEFSILEVKKRSLPELNDEFAQSLGEYTDIATLRDAIRVELETNERDTYNEQYDESVLEKICGISIIKYPSDMIAREQQNMLETFKNRLASQNMDLELYLKTRQQTEDEFMKEIYPVAEKRVNKYLVLSEISKAENVKVDHDEIQAAANRKINEIHAGLADRRLPKNLEQELIDNISENLMIDMVINTTVERLREIASEGKSSQLDTEDADTKSDMIETDKTMDQ